MTCDRDARGVLVTFEGGEGAGKSTHIGILAAALEACGREVVRLREPGGTAIGEKLRAVVLDPGNSEMADECELLIYEAARAQLVSQVIVPALARGAAVLCDRFCDSTVAYQAAGRGLDEAFVRRANEFACQGVAPDLTILMDAGGACAGLARAAGRGRALDRLERAGDGFHARVAAAFDGIAASDSGRVRVVRSAASKSATARSVFSAAAPVLPELRPLLLDEGFFSAFDGASAAACAAAAAEGAQRVLGRCGMRGGR